jgi:hypothetical protein
MSLVQLVREVRERDALTVLFLVLAAVFERNDRFLMGRTAYCPPRLD